MVPRGVPGQVPAPPQGPAPSGKGAELPVLAPIAGATLAERVLLARVAQEPRHDGMPGAVHHANTARHGDDGYDGHGDADGVGNGDDDAGVRVSVRVVRLVSVELVM